MTRHSRYLVSALLLSSSGVGLGCSSSYGNADAPIGVSRDTPERIDVDEPPEDTLTHDTLPHDVVERAALPFYGYDVAAGEPLEPKTLFSRLAEAHAVCVGERHPNPHDHYAQLYVIQELARRAEMSGKELGVGLEMFQQQFQVVLDDYAADAIDEETLLVRSEYAKRWGLAFSLYRPQLEHAKSRGAALLALNAPRELTKEVATHGLADVPAELAKSLPADLDLTDAEHRALFDEAMRGHPHGIGQPDDLYAAQVVWDESMAEASAKWLSERHPARQLVVLAGTLHCHDSAIPARIRRRMQMGASVVSVLPIIKEDGENLAQRLAGYDYGFVMLPEGQKDT